MQIYHESEAPAPAPRSPSHSYHCLYKNQPQITQRREQRTKHGEKIKWVLYNIGKDPEEESKSCCITREASAASSSSSPQASSKVGKVDIKPTPTQTIKKRSKAGLKEMEEEVNELLVAQRIGQASFSGRRASVRLHLLSPYTTSLLTLRHPFSPFAPFLLTCNKCFWIVVHIKLGLWWSGPGF